MSSFTRRNVALGLGAAMALSACGNGIGSGGAEQIDARVQSTLNYLYSTYPGTADLAAEASGMLVMPVVTELGILVGGSYGRGALLVGQSTVDYYSAAAASAGLQLGAQQYSHVLFFMTEDALMEFRRSPGWVMGADVEYVISNEGEILRAETTTVRTPVIAMVFAQAGLRVGATLDGTKYTRIIP